MQNALPEKQGTAGLQSDNDVRLYVTSNRRERRLGSEFSAGCLAPPLCLLPVARFKRVIATACAMGPGPTLTLG
jgi:hypothetical protein